LRLKNKYDKTIIIITWDVSFLFDIVDNVTVINKGNIVLSEGKEIFYNNNLYKYVNMPKIIEFTRCAEVNGHDIKKCLDIKELIKELYRNVR
jgi:ABC-type dipeptide/oligopeptide/nickel transport system ATPase component